MISFVVWWVIIQVFGLAALPLARRIFTWLPDRGYAFSKAIGLLMVSYLLWLGAITGILANTTGGILLALLLTAGISLWAGFSRGRLVDELRSFFKKYRWHGFAAELLFLLAFAAWATVRAYAPEKIMPAGGEKFMEIAFLNGVLNSPRFPPLDPWMAGYSISYYYFAYVMMAVMTRLSGAIPTVGFDLYDALIFALTALTAYGVVFNLVASASANRTASSADTGSSATTHLPAGIHQSENRAAMGFGLLGALFVTVMGNLEGLLEGLYAARLLPAAFWQWIDIPDLVGSSQTGAFYPGNSWWWWHASRVLHDLDLFHKPVIFQPIDEFPFFSFLLGDNHPHKLALPFVLLTVGLAFNLFIRQAKRTAAPADPSENFTNLNQALHWAWGRRAEIGLFLFYALALGALAFLNTWDFPIYLGLVLLAYAAGKLMAGERLGLGLLGQVIVLAIWLGIGAILLYIFFYISFSSQAGGILPYVFEPTRLPQYLVMFGPFIFILAFFIIGAAIHSAGRRIPLGEMLRAWAWVVGLSILAFLLVLLVSLVIIRRSGLESNPFIQQWLNGMTLSEGFSRVLLSRLNDPWLFLLLSAMLAVIITSLLRSLAGAGRVATEQASLPETPRKVVPDSSPVQQPPELPYPPVAPATQFVLLMAFLALALTLVVEFFYLRDNFGMRMNTIFKFYYQGWVMMACASAYAAWWVTRFTGKLTRAVFAAGTVLLVTAGLVYPLMGAYSRADGFKQPPTLDAAATFAGKYPGEWAAQPGDWAAIQWLLDNGRLPDGSVPRILEAGSGGYENAGRISAFTGFPTILGWENHEGQWRGSLTEINRRIPVIRTIYTTPDAKTALDLLHQWNVRYVIVGDAERSYVSKLCQDKMNPCNTNKALAKFDQSLTKVFSQGGTTVYQVPGSTP